MADTIVTTVGDLNYLPNVYALVESLKNTIPVHYLAIGENARIVADQNQLENLIVHDECEILRWNPQLIKLKDENYKYYCWTLASNFTLYILLQSKTNVCYVDSDILFHKPINKLIDQFETYSIALFRHRMFSLSSNPVEGRFNVGVIYFRNDATGIKCLKWWANSVAYRLYPEYQTCGDQKYLDYIYDKYNKYIFVDGEVGHGAPWHWQLYELQDLFAKGLIYWEGKPQKYFFTHFSQMKCNFSLNEFIPSTMHHCYTPIEAYGNDTFLMALYTDYFQKVKRMYTNLFW